MARSVIKESALSRLIKVRLTFDSTTSGFPIPANVRKPNDNSNFQLTLTARNRITGAIYIIWYDNGTSSFRMGSVISGAAPANGDTVDVNYIVGN